MMQISWPILDVLSHRGVEDAEDFFRSPTWRDMPSPFTVSGVSEVVSRIRAAIRSQERIAAYGDYVECVIMPSVTVHTRMNAARCAHSAPHNLFRASGV